MCNYHMKNKSDAPDAFRDFLVDIGHPHQPDSQSNITITLCSWLMTGSGSSAQVYPVIHADRDTVLTSGEFGQLCAQAGFRQSFSTPGMPQQNGVAERAQRTIVEPATAMLISAQKPSRYWTWAFDFAVFSHSQK